MAVQARVRVGDRLERLHVVPEVVGLDAGQQLVRRIVRAGVARPRRRFRRRAGGREQAYGEAGCDEPRPRESRRQTFGHEDLPLEDAAGARHTKPNCSRGATAPRRPMQGASLYAQRAHLATGYCELLLTVK